jgi:hypothetical protein
MEQKGEGRGGEGRGGGRWGNHQSALQTDNGFPHSSIEEREF